MKIHVQIGVIAYDYNQRRRDAKHARAKRDLKAARPYRVGAQFFYENAQVGLDAEGKVVPVEAGQKDLYVALISDRGLWCCLAF